MFFDLGPLKLVTLAVLAVVIFGPDKLPRLVSDAMGFLRTIRSFADNAKQDIRNELGPDFKDFEFEDLNPKTFVRKQLAAHGEDLGLADIHDLKDSLAHDAAAATDALRAVRANPLGTASPVTPPIAAALTEHSSGESDAT